VAGEEGGAGAERKEKDRGWGRFQAAVGVL